MAMAPLPACNPALMSSGIIKKTRIFRPFLLAGRLLATFGTTLLHNIDLDPLKARYIGP